MRGARFLVGVAWMMVGARGSPAVESSHPRIGFDLGAPVDAILFRTHFVDDLVLAHLRELLHDSTSPHESGKGDWSFDAGHGKSVAPGTSVTGTGPGLGSGVLHSTKYEINVLFDADLVPDFHEELMKQGLNSSSAGLRLEGLKLKDFAAYPHVEKSAVAKSHQQHLAYTLWWKANRGRRNWRFIWCIEHDVAVTGGMWRSVLDAHLAPPHAGRDLIGWRVGWALRADKVHGGGQWNIGKRYGKIAVPNNEVAVYFGPLIRFSARYLSYLELRSRDGSMAHSEIAPPTLCNVTSWCTMGNLSIGVMGGKDGGLFDYALPTAITSDIFAAMTHLSPGKIFHPVRDVASASSKSFVNHKVEAHHHAAASYSAKGMEAAKCLIRNPRPPRPSFNCPFGCPYHEQITCPTVNCMAREPGTYYHMGFQMCLSLCAHFQKCPWTTGTEESLALSKKGIGFTEELEGDFVSVAGPV